jgi:hypothetical protein
MTQLVGIDNASDEVINMLSPTGNDEKLKIISIVGFGGMGKTTLAKFVHDKLMKGKNFQCGAFVSVGQNPEPLEGVLMNMISRLSNKLYKAVLSSPMDRPLLIHKLRHFLQDKRYALRSTVNNHQPRLFFRGLLNAIRLQLTSIAFAPT